MSHSGQLTQLQTLHSVSCHGQLVHRRQSLQNRGDVSEVVEGEPETVELGKPTQLLGQGAEVVSIQRQRLQATGSKTVRIPSEFSTCITCVTVKHL